MKKKILYLGLSIILLIAILFTLTGCSNKEENKKTNDEDTSMTLQNEQKSKITPKRDTSKEWGYVDESDNWVIEPQYRTASEFSKNGLALISVHKEDSVKYGYINENNEVVLDLIYDEAQVFSSEGYAGAVTDDKVGIINSQGEFVCTFENVWYAAFCEETNLVKVVKDKHTDRVYAFYDLEGNQITEYKYWEANIGGIVTSCNNGYIEICDKDTMLYGLLDKTGKEIVECKYKTMLYYSDEELWLVTDDSEKYFINEKGEKVKDW